MRRLTWTLTVSLSVAYGCGDDGTSGAGGAGGSSTTGQGGGATPCVTADDCPISATECAVRSCEAGLCGTTPVAAGTPAKTQALEDCKRIECDGAGSSQAVPDDDDVKNDNNPCTTDSCSMGMRVHDPLPVATPCGESGVCDASGACVSCLGATDCGVATECSSPTCEAGACGTDFAPDGQPVAVQTAGDCQAVVCDGAGSTTSIEDATDVFDDSNPCTIDVCQGGVPQHTADPGAPCGTDGTCDDQGQCVGCVQPTDCPGTDDFCKTRTCSAGGVCGFSFTAAGTELPAPLQTSGDCVTLSCNGAGLVQPLVAATDIPVDGNECTLDQCVGGSPMNPPLSQGSPCTMGGAVCNGAGSCVDCNSPADCVDPPGACVVAACNAGSCGQANAPDGTVCAAASCSGGVAQLADTCQAGACSDGGTTACGAYACGPSACLTSCADSAGCAAGATCDTGLAECTTGPTCTAYCNSIETACVGGNDQYFSASACLAACAVLPDGGASDTSGNTVGCRTYHATAAASAPAVHCPHAGPGGAGVCGNDCDGFCSIALGVCTGPNQVFADLGQCQSACAGFPTTPAYSASVTSGDSFACRLYHLTAAALDPATHCSHIVEASPTCN